MLSGCVRLHVLSPRVSQQVLLSAQKRYASTVGLQRARPLNLRRELLGAQQARNLWWPSKKPEAESQSTSSEPTPVDAFAQSEQPLANVEATSAAEAPAAQEYATLSESTTAEVASATGTDLQSIPTEVVPDLSSIPSVTQALQYGDLAALGLAGWTPAGFCRWGIELLQVSTGLPWFWTIVTATVVSRLVILPFSIKSMQYAARLAKHQDEVTSLREKMTEAQASRDVLAMQSLALRQRQIYTKANVSIPGMMALPFVQLPIQLGMFFGIKKMCDLPLEQLKHSGLDILPDLTATDPTWTLPIIGAVLINLQLRLGIRDMQATPALPHIINFFRVFSVVGVFLMSSLPSGVLTYLGTTMVFGIAQTLVLRIPAVRTTLGVPIVPKEHQPKPVSFMESIRYAQKWWDEQKSQAKAGPTAAKRR
ncbi:hypothetical protein CERSUDRAFT_157655 [Gelatoporia subvermispora B]|uniref:Membrane insertase YidC/Oxa/ALB C-terminal domain-containing protein n=1 Tax=Ceriporiopsis subvermispora (strain B) TaxID=914234 RepID=M2QS01_CERS8|nr:hypothetical protein CERSUDRAFT_157655 [Gelatoporia subvermispora B]